MRRSLPWSMLLLSMALLAARCEEVGGTDLDGDGYGPISERGEDCDDEDATVHPDAPEDCDGLDQDCDGLIDEGAAEALWLDQDGDGFGDPESPVEACAGDAVANDLDCDDADSRTGAAQTWYPDLDGDLYGDDAGAVTLCEAPEGTVKQGGDCDDSDPSLHPDTLWTVDADGDGFGDPKGDSARQCEAAEGYARVEPPDCDDSDPAIHPDAVELCDALDNDCDDASDEGFEFVQWFEDSDGDGYGDPRRSVETCEESPSGYVLNELDCEDDNAEANPDQSDWFEESRGDGSFDYDCDGAEELRYPDEGQCGGSKTSCFVKTEGFLDEVPECGETGDMLTACIDSTSSCVKETSSVTQSCR